MKLDVKYLTENECYKVNKKIRPRGIVVHSVGCAQPNREAFVRSWNTFRPNGRQVCLHAFVDDKGVTQTLPWDTRCWGCGQGNKGSFNDTHIQFEICEPSNVKYSGGSLVGYNATINEEFFINCYNNAVELCVMLCKKFGLTEKDIVCHCEAHQMGYASNHSDVMQWFPKHGKSMDTFRVDVKKQLESSDDSTNDSNNTPDKTDEVIKSLYKVQIGAFRDRNNALKLESELKKKGYSTFVVYEKSLYKVQCGAFKDKSNAINLSNKLKADGYDTYII